MTKRTTRTPQGDVNLAFARLMETLRFCHSVAVDAGDAEAAHIFREWGSEVGAVMKQRADEQQAVSP